jgi:ring-1,2-phenylacetyl-CoA epoxidase subunit PaaC
MELNSPYIQYLLHLADNALIHCQRLSEWCGHAPDVTEDTLAYQRTERQFYNVLLVEQPNVDFAFTLAKCFYFDIFQKLLYQGLSSSIDEGIKAIATKSLKEVTYHQRFSSEWVIRLGDGNELSKSKIQQALVDAWVYTGELFDVSAYEQQMVKEGIAIPVDTLKQKWLTTVQQVITDATLLMPGSADAWHQQGGKQGIHSEQMGFILAEMQYMQRAYPNSTW